MIDQAWLDRAQEDGGCVSRLELLHAQFTGQDWSELEVRNSSFQGCTFTDCDFSGTAFYDCGFSGCLSGSSAGLSSVLRSRKFFTSAMSILPSATAA